MISPGLALLTALMISAGAVALISRACVLKGSSASRPARTILRIMLTFLVTQPAERRHGFRILGKIAAHPGRGQAIQGRAPRAARVGIRRVRGQGRFSAAFYRRPEGQSARAGALESVPPRPQARRAGHADVESRLRALRRDHG